MVLREVLREYSDNIQRITRAPWQSLPSTLMIHLAGLEFPSSLRDLQIEAMLAMCGVVQKSVSFQGAWQAILRATESDVAMLWPWLPWHDGTSPLPWRITSQTPPLSYQVVALATPGRRCSQAPGRVGACSRAS